MPNVLCHVACCFGRAPARATTAALSGLHGTPFCNSDCSLLQSVCSICLANCTGRLYTAGVRKAQCLPNRHQHQARKAEERCSAASCLSLQGHNMKLAGLLPPPHHVPALHVCPGQLSPTLMPCVMRQQAHDSHGLLCRWAADADLWGAFLGAAYLASRSLHRFITS